MCLSTRSKLNTNHNISLIIETRVYLLRFMMHEHRHRHADEYNDIEGK